MSRLAIVVIGAVCFLLIPVSEAASKCTSVQAQCAVEIGGQCDPNMGQRDCKTLHLNASNCTNAT